MTAKKYNCSYCDPEKGRPNSVGKPGDPCEEISCERAWAHWMETEGLANAMRVVQVLGMPDPVMPSSDEPVSYPREVGPCRSMTFDVESITVSPEKYKKYLDLLWQMTDEVRGFESDPDVMPLGHYHWPRWATFDPKPLVAPDPLSGPSSGYEGSEQTVVQSLPEGEQDQPFDFTPDQPDKQFRLGHRPADEPPDESGDA